ncbi:MAG: beta-galactosidase [Paludibacter sp.]|nr:beta-galactosidase [Paludibacter sp.]
MKHLFLLVLLFILFPFKGQSFSQDLNLGKFSMPIGAYYYPEQWDENQWDRDLKHMSDLGFEFTHFAEFAWSRLEPKDGNFDFSWLDKNISLAGKYGLKVVLCTPSATPPAWLTSKHPEILIKLESGFKVKHGMRLNCNGSNPIYQKYINRLVTKMAERYGNNPIVAGWQIDNEPHFEGLYDYSDFSQNAFRKWLKTKYQSIEKLNQSWGASFWSFTYNNFNQIFIPNKNEHAGNQHALLDFKRYTADALAEAVRFQTTILRNSVSKDQWVTTNFAYYKFLPSVDLFRNQKDLDFASHTMYLLSTFLNTDKGEMAYRLGSGMELSFSGEMARSIKGFTGIMELQPGQINWGQWNSQPLPGAVRMWIWHCFGLGEKFVCTYRFRQPLFGGEQFHKGIVEPDGLTVSPGGKEFVQAIAEIGKLKIDNSQTIETPHEIQTRTTAFLWKQENLLALEDTKGTNSWNTWAHYYSYYQCLKSMGCPVTFIQETDNFDVQKYPFMVAPAYEMVDKKLIDKWTKYVADGGHLVLTTRTGMKDKNGHLWETLLQQPIWDLIGAKIDFFDQLPPTKTSTVEFADKKYGWNVWGDVITPTQHTEVWSTHTDNFYTGKAAAVNHKLGKGSVLYVGVVSTEGEFENALLRKFYLQSGAQILHLPDYVFVEWRNGYWVAVNYGSKQFELPVPNGKEIVFGDKSVMPGGVTVWK